MAQQAMALIRMPTPPSRLRAGCGMLGRLIARVAVRAEYRGRFRSRRIDERWTGRLTRLRLPVAAMLVVAACLSLVASAASAAPPANDDFADAVALTGLPANASGTNVDATKEAGEPTHAGIAGGGFSVWWSWTAPSTGGVAIETCGSAFPTVLGVYTGSSVEALTEVASGRWQNAEEACSGGARVSFRATAGQTYMIAVDNYLFSGRGAIALAIKPAPDNDDFASASAIGSFPTEISATNAGATTESGEPNHAGASAGHSVWWRWTASANGNVLVDTCKLIPFNNAFTTVAVYSGGSLGGLSEVASTSSGCSGESGGSRVVFPAAAGQEYRIAVASKFAQVTRPFTLKLAPPPVNDDFADATLISGLPASVDGSNVHASAEPGEPAHAGRPPFASLWWRWTAPSDGKMIVDACSSEVATRLGVYVGTNLAGLSEMVSGGCHLILNASAGQSYRIAVDNVSDPGALGAITLELRRPPANDDFAGALVLNGAFAFVTAQQNLDATKEPREPNHAGNPGGHSLWYRWTAPATGPATADTCDGDFDTVIGVYTGDAVGSLTEIAADDDSCSRLGGSFAEFDAQAGQTYYIAVDGRWPGVVGSFDLYVEGAEPTTSSTSPGTSSPATSSLTLSSSLAADTTGPPLKLGGASLQKVLRQRGLLIVAGCATEACTVTAKGSVTIRGAARVFRFTPATKHLPKGGKATLKLGLRRRALKAVGRALKAGKKLSAKVSVTGKDAAGNVTTKRRTIRLKR
jgi:hypothetical protein